jgi:hypothetical protein
VIVGEQDDGTAEWALREAERKLRIAAQTLLEAAYRLHPLPGRAVVRPDNMDIHRSGRLEGLATMVQTASTLVRRIRNGNA